MSHLHQINIPAVYMRAGAGKGVLFRLQDLTAAARLHGEASGNPDHCCTGKSVIVSASARPCHDVDCLFGHVPAGEAFVDWGGDCCSLSAAIGLFAIRTGLIHRERIPQNGMVAVRIWQANMGKTIVAHVPVADGQIQQTVDAEVDGESFPAAEVQLEFMDPVSGKEGSGSVFPTGNLVDELDVPGVGTLKTTMIDAGIPTILVDAADLGCRGMGLQDAIDGNPMAPGVLELIRAHGAVRMGLIEHAEQAARPQQAPAIALVAPPIDYLASGGKQIAAGDIDLLVCALSMDWLHEAAMDPIALAIGTAAAIPGTLASLAAGGRAREAVRVGHRSGTLRAGAVAREIDGEWIVPKAVMSRSARADGWPLRVPGRGA